MKNLPDWLPELIGFQGDWKRYEDKIYARFYSDFIASTVWFRGLPVKVSRNLIRGKERSFWHLIQEGRIEEERTPDIRRCERIAWIKAIIEHASDQCIKCWNNRRGNKTRLLLWHDGAEYLVVLEQRPNAWHLITAYCVTRQHRKKKLQREYEAFIKKPTPP